MRAHIDLLEHRSATTGGGAGHRETWWPLALYALIVTVAIVIVVVTVP